MFYLKKNERYVNFVGHVYFERVKMGVVHMRKSFYVIVFLILGSRIQIQALN